MGSRGRDDRRNAHYSTAPGSSPRGFPSSNRDEAAMSTSTNRAPEQDAALGHSSGCVSRSDHDRNVPGVDLLTPLPIRGVTVPNRIGMSPMCQYIAGDGLA